MHQRQKTYQQQQQTRTNAQNKRPKTNDSDSENAKNSGQSGQNMPGLGQRFHKEGEKMSWERQEGAGNFAGNGSRHIDTLEMVCGLSSGFLTVCMHMNRFPLSMCEN